MTISLTEDQDKAAKAFQSFLADDTEPVFVLSGYAGTGKSTLVKHLMDNLDNYLRMAKLVNPGMPEYVVSLTATTNKAADNLSSITGKEVVTTQSFLGLRVETNFETRKTKLVQGKNSYPQYNQLVFVDEASYVDSQLLQWIFSLLKNSKVVFIGDDAQLTPVLSNAAPVFKASFPGAALTKVMRQAEGNPILDLATKFRNTVNTGEFFSFIPDEHHIRHLNEQEFSQEIEKEFNRPDWKHNDSKILAWTNQAVTNYNKEVSAMCSNTTEFSVGDYVVVNKYFNNGSVSFKTDETVLITSIQDHVQSHGVWGKMYGLNGKSRVFSPDLRSDRVAAEKKASVEAYRYITNNWIDIRAVFSCTINKSQGSTYDKVFIDLNDLAKCSIGNTLARLLYVGVSRARNHVYFTGDLV